MFFWYPKVWDFARVLAEQLASKEHQVLNCLAPIQQPHILPTTCAQNKSLLHTQLIPIRSCHAADLTLQIDLKIKQ